MIQGSNTFGGAITDDFRGIKRKTTTTIPWSNDQLFLITKGMLRTATSNSSHSFITLTAEFVADGNKDGGVYINNPTFYTDASGTTSRLNSLTGDDLTRDQSSTFISKFDVKVEYLGELNVDINWIKIETPNQTKIFEGYYDDYMLAGVQAMTGGLYTQPSVNQVVSKVFRYYSFDEMLPMQYEAMRYYNLLLDTIAATESFQPQLWRPNEDGNFPHYFYSTGLKQFWNGSTQNFSSYHAAPFIRNTQLIGADPSHKLNKSFNLLLGYTGYAGQFGVSTPYTSSTVTTNTSVIADTLNSMYETLFGINERNIPSWEEPQSRNPFNYPYSFFETTNYQEFSSVQQAIDYRLFSTIYKNPIIYYNYPFWSNMWVQGSLMPENIPIGNNTYSTLMISKGGHARPRTGEESRYAFNTNLIKGTKGFFIWFKNTGYKTYSFFDSTSTIFTKSVADYDGVGLQNNTNSTLTGENLVYNDDIGGDFIKLNNDPNGYDLFYRPYTNPSHPSAYNFDVMGIQKERMYIGIKSVRSEVYKLFTYIKSVEPTLLKLNMIAYKNKGFIEFSSAKNSSLTIDKFIDTANIVTRPLGRVKNGAIVNGFQTKVPYFENQGTYPSGTFTDANSRTFTYDSTLAGKQIDSAFYEVSILKHNDKDTEIEFYIGIQNRRTDPLLTFSETITTPTGDKVDNSMKFYSTAELDQKAHASSASYSYNTSSSITGTVGSGTVTSIVNGVSRTYTSPYPPEFWQQQWWQRLGCREIRIPINLAGLSNTDAKTMVKVTELGVGESIASEWWWDNKYRHTVDTSFFKGNDIVIRMLPGEGKILKVEVVRLVDTMNISGRLDYSNQNKIVSFTTETPPYQSSTITPTTVRYHMVYQKYQGDENNGVPRNQVFYRRSREMTKNINSYTSFIDWEPQEHLLSAQIVDYSYQNNSSTASICNSNTFTRDTVPCGYPNIVVRVDSSTTPAVTKVYVVYDCWGENNPTMGAQQQVAIVENVFNANDAFQIVPNTGYVIAKADADNHYDFWKYGLTAINAAYEGNYYAWNDKNRGIVAGFKKPEDRCLRTTLQVTDNCTYQYPLCAQTNPSMNTYSRIPYQDVDASLVWTCNTSCSITGGSGQSRIAYTRLWYNAATNTISKKLGRNICGEQHSTFERYSCDSNIYYFSNLNIISSQAYPVVYRNVEFFKTDVSQYYDPFRANKNDHVYWQGKDWDSKEVIFNATISNWDFNPGVYYNQPDCIGAVYSSHIRHEQWGLIHPTAAQGTLRREGNEFKADADPRDPNGFEARTNDLDFVTSVNSAGTTSNQNIWHIPHGWQSLLMGWTYLLGNFDNFPLSMRTNTSNALYPHLSKQVTFNTDQEKKYNRRIYNKDWTPTAANIKSSLEFFAKDNLDESEQSGIPFFGFDTGKERSYFTGISLIKNGISENLRINFLKNTEKGKIIEDTVTSNWFTISNNDQVNFIINNNDNSDRFKFYLQRKSDSKLIKLFKYQTKSDLFKQGLVFLSDTTDTYRLIWHDSNLKTFTQELLLGNKAVMMKKERANPDFVTFIDLRNGSQIDSKSEEDLLLSIYPNPATNKFSIFTGINRSMANQSRCKVEVKVINQLGLVLMSKIVPLGEVVTYDSEDLPSGQYFVQVETLEGFDGSCEHFMNVKPVSIVK